MQALVNRLMLTHSVSLILATILSMGAFTTITASAQQGQQQVESDGELEVTLNGDSFTTGDTITISGTVEKRDIDSVVCLDVIDPNSVTVEISCPAVTADNTFIYSFKAGMNTEFDSAPMEASGNYRLIARYLVPNEPITSEDFSEEVEFVFAYRHVEGQQQQDTTTGLLPSSPPQDTNTVRRMINVTAINKMVSEGLGYVEQLTTSMQMNDTTSMLTNLEGIQHAFQNIQGNLTGITPLAQGEVIVANNTTGSNNNNTSGTVAPDDLTGPLRSLFG